MPEELWVEIRNTVQEVDQNHLQEKEMQKGKTVVWEGLTNIWEEKLKAKKKRKDVPIWMQSSRE